MLAVSFTLSLPAMVALGVGSVLFVLCSIGTVKDVKQKIWKWSHLIIWFVAVGVIPTLIYFAVNGIQKTNQRHVAEAAVEAKQEATVEKLRKQDERKRRLTYDANRMAGVAEEKAKQAAQEKVIQEMPEWHGIVKILSTNAVSTQAKLAYVQNAISSIEQKCALPPISIHLYEYITELFTTNGDYDREARKMFPDMLAVCIDPLKIDEAMKEFDTEKRAGKYDPIHYYKGPKVREYVPEEHVAEEHVAEASE